MTRNFQVVLDEVASRLTTRDARRLFHGRGHFYPGFDDLNIDQFADFLLITGFDTPLVDCEALSRLLSEVAPAVKGIGLQVRRGRQVTSQVLVGEIPDRVIATEDQLKFWVELGRNQNVGLFLDMAPARRWLTEQVGYYPATAKPRVLNLFAFTCAFSVAAIQAGAQSVVNNDMAASALKWGRANHELNDHDLRRVSMLSYKLLKSWSKISNAGPYDIIVIDPPSNQRGSFNAERQYSQVMKRLPALANPNAWILACLNSPFLGKDFLPGQMARFCPKCEWVGTLPRSPDFPDRSADSGLKTELFRFRG